ncbi:MAG TPA: MerR family transcriptional regulator [Treponemataceae bacterium]|jgi:DNA-binding transcriptional MerR regulator/DNA gyrase inhibitor GyrI|nr:MerR family transcriptional regulator [Treponema sp.]HOU38141.1 MerR family transcriptional regulator [Treponemataceae bacterium]HQF73325.1 MerR family transcriptional regulator [Treponemataceae bacterium]
MMTIGEFSQATRLSLKALRIYHEEGLLVPESVDPHTGYRKYGDESFTRAASITALKELGFSVKEMTSILASCKDDGDLAGFLEKRLAAVEKELAGMNRIRNSIKFLLETQRIPAMEKAMHITIQTIPPATILGIRYRGRYDECGAHFSTLFRTVGRFVTGAPFCLYHEPAEEDGTADIEACVTLRKALTVSGMNCRVLEERKCVTAVWKGPYEGLGEAYRQLFEYINANQLESNGPIQEVYLKGPGMIIPRNPKRFLTEIRISVK